MRRRILNPLSLACLIYFVAGPLESARAQEVVPETEPVEIPLTQAVDEPDRVHLQIDFLYWWLQRLKTPPLLTAGPAGTTGILGDPGTTLLRGGDRITSRHDRYVGVRGGLDWWFGPERIFGAELNAFFMERDSTHYSVRHGAEPTLAIPYVDQFGRNQAFVVSGNNSQFGNLFGSTNVYSRMELFGQEANGLLSLARGLDRQWTAFAGLRTLQLRERLDLTSSAFILPQRSTLIGLEDHFQTFNKFYGGQVGLIRMRRWGRLSFEGRAAVALGANDEEIRNKGQFIYHTPQQRQASPYGLFVQPSNTGQFEHVEFNVVTEVRLKIAYELRRWLSVELGYSFLTWNGPVRPGDQVVAVNRTQTQPGGLQGTLTPLPQFKEDFFWAHGLNAGIAVRW